MLSGDAAGKEEFTRERFRPLLNAGRHPRLAPVAIAFGVDPVDFGLIMVVNLALGMITPPFGVNLFAACQVADIPLEGIVRHLAPFVLVIVACLAIVTYVPDVTLRFRDLLT